MKMSERRLWVDALDDPGGGSLRIAQNKPISETAETKSSNITGFTTYALTPKAYAWFKSEGSFELVSITTGMDRRAPDLTKRLKHSKPTHFVELDV